MIEDILKWPEQIGPENLQTIDFGAFFDQEPLISNTETFHQFHILKSIHNAIKSADSRTIKEAGVFSSLDDIQANWSEVLNGVRRAAQQDPGNLGTGTFLQNGNQYKFSLNPNSSIGGYELVGDPAINQPDLQRDFGRLYEIGTDIEAYQIATKGGLRSPLTRAARKAINDDTQKAKSELTAHTATEAQRISAEVRAAIAIRGWSQYYKSRCVELKKIIDGAEATKKTRIRKTTKKYLKNSLYRDFRHWRKYLLLALGFYAIGAVFLLINPFGYSYTGQLTNGFSRYFLGLTLYGLLGGVFLGYSYASKQLKVHQNLYEQYRHRAVVAETIEGIIAAVIKTKNDTLDEGEVPSVIEQSQLETLVKVAANAMFENRPIGHLSSKEASGGLLGEFLGRNN